MSSHEQNKKTTDYEIQPLENGEPVRVYGRLATSINLKEEIESASPIATALIRLADGRNVVANRRAMVMLGQPSRRGYFSKDENTRGARFADVYPNGIPDIEIGTQWADVGAVDKVAIRPKEAFAQTEVFGGDGFGLSMFESAEVVLNEFERASRLAEN